MNTDEIQLVITKLDVRPGDVLLVKTNRRLEPQEGARVMDTIKTLVSSPVTVVICDPDFDIQTLRSMVEEQDRSAGGTAAPA